MLRARYLLLVLHLAAAWCGHSLVQAFAIPTARCTFRHGMQRDASAIAATRSVQSRCTLRHGMQRAASAVAARRSVQMLDAHMPAAAQRKDLGGLHPSHKYPVGPHIKINKLVLNTYGLWYGLNALVAGLLIFPFVALAGLIGRIVDRKRLRAASWFGSIWCRLSLLTMLIKPKVIGQYTI
jgi:hypothetical protein